VAGSKFFQPSPGTVCRGIFRNDGRRRVAASRIAGRRHTGTIVGHFSSWVNGFGFMTMERNGARQWDIKVWDTSGYQVDSCRINGSKSVCEITWVK
jgi:hypothetical protein